MENVRWGFFFGVFGSVKLIKIMKERCFAEMTQDDSRINLTETVVTERSRIDQGSGRRFT